MSKAKKAILLFTATIILTCISVVVYKAVNPVSLVPQPLLGPGIYLLSGAYSDKGLTTFYANGLIWSPNGKYIAGIVHKYGYPDFCLGCGTPHAEIFIIDAAKMEKQIVLWSDSDNPKEFEGPIAWFSDGEHLAFMTGEHLNNNRKIWSTDLAGKNIYQFLQEQGDPVWSPDGSRIALLETRKVSGNWMSYLYIFDLSTQAKRLIYKSEDTDFFIDSVSWTPNGKNVVFAYGRMQDYTILYADIFLFDLESNKISRVTDDAFEYGDAEYSPVNNLIALQRIDNAAPDFDHRYMTVIRNLVNNCEVVLPILDTTSISWSPDGQKLVITSNSDAYIVNLTEFFGEKFRETGLICP